MTHFVSVAKVARALGINRAELRQRIDSAGIATFEGAIDLEELRRIAPRFDMGEDDIMERTRLIRENAKALRHDPGNKPSSEDPHQQIRRLTVDLLLEKRRVERYEQIVNDLFKRFEEIQVSPDSGRRDVALELGGWLAKTLGAP
ncbi:MAG: hypothetical protein HQL37_02340 [Alphaproteobacteria bacterium]|nr:hypothetical protein [Alphaproteobacteria bacterium]